MPYKEKLLWKLIYKIYPPILRVLEKFRLHSTRQPFLVGNIKDISNIQKIEQHIIKQWYEHSILAWMDPGEILSMRKLDKKVYQYHIRIFHDGEVRWHYEYASEASPFKHIFQIWFKDTSDYFKGLLKGFFQ